MLNPRNLEQRISKLEQASGVGIEPVVVLIEWSGGPLRGYHSGGFGGRPRVSTMRRPGESDKSLLERAIRATTPQRPPAEGMYVLDVIRDP